MPDYRLIRLIGIGSMVAICCAFLFFGAHLLPDKLAEVLFDLSAGSSYPYTIQNVMWLMFAVGLGELSYRIFVNQRQRSALRQSYLPDQPSDERRVLTVEDMPHIYRGVKTVKSELADLVKSLALRFQAGKSVEQTHQLLNSRLELWQYRLDLDYTMLRYISWLIPTIGFIGTVVGISRALSFAGSGEISPESAEFLPVVTSQLGLAFDTTMLALAMSVLLVFLTHFVQEREERTVEASGRYCLDNLITRLYIA